MGLFRSFVGFALLRRILGGRRYRHRAPRRVGFLQRLFGSERLARTGRW